MGGAPQDAESHRVDSATVAKNPSRSEVRRRVARRKSRRGGGSIWYVAVGVIIVLFVGLIVVSRPDASTGLQISDHWHTAVGVNVCGTWQGPPPATGNGNLFRPDSNVYAGLHTHADGLMHMEPRQSDEIGKHATVGQYFAFNGWSLSETAFTYNDGVKQKNGDTCPAKDGKPAYKGVVRWAVGHAKAGALPGKLVEQTGNPANYVPKNEDQFALYFVAKDAKLSGYGNNVPSRACLPNALAVEQGPAQCAGDPTAAAAMSTIPGVGSGGTTAPGAPSSSAVTTTAAVTSKP